MSSCAKKKTIDQFQHNQNYDLSNCQINILDARYIPYELVLNDISVPRSDLLYTSSGLRGHKACDMTLNVTNTSQDRIYLERELSLIIEDNDKEYYGHLSEIYKSENLLCSLSLEAGESKQVHYYVFCEIDIGDQPLLKIQNDDLTIKGQLKVDEVPIIDSSCEINDITFTPLQIYNNTDRKVYGIELLISNNSNSEICLGNDFYLYATYKKGEKRLGGASEWSGSYLSETNEKLESIPSSKLSPNEQKRILFRDHVTYGDTGLSTDLYSGIFYLSYLDECYRIDMR